LAVGRGSWTASSPPPPVIKGKGPLHIGAKTAEIRQKSKNRAAPPPACLAGARAMFLTNIHIKNDTGCFT